MNQGSGLDLLVGPIANLYGALAALERVFFRFLPFLVRRPEARVVSIGNLSVGGTGKTPLLLELLADPGRPAGTIVLSRGYRSPWERGFYLLRGPGPHPAGVTDEALLVNQAFPEVPVLLGKNRAHTAAMAEKWFRPRLILLDDGFQYRRLARDVDLVLWDATMAPGAARLLPLGRLREPAGRLAAAGGILLTRCESVDADRRSQWRKFLSRHAPGKPILETATVPADWLDPAGRPVPLADGPGRAVAYAAVANPAPFFRSLDAVGCLQDNTYAFRDHSPVAAPRLAAMAAEARRVGGVLVCTGKDRVKVDPQAALGLGLWTLRTRLRTVDGLPIGAALRSLGLFP